MVTDNDLPLGVRLKKLQQRDKKPTWKKRETKNRPIEASTRKPIGGFVKNSLNTQQKKGFDPRFDSLCGKYEKHHFSNSYGFLSGMIENEEKQLEKQLRSTSDPVELISLRKELSRLRKLRNRVLKETSNTKKESKLRQSNGKQIFISQRRAKEESIKEKYEALKKSGKLKQFIEKRRKKQVSKDRRLLPPRRTADVQ